MGGDPAVSIVIPAKDESAYLPRTLASLDRLVGGPPFEVIVVDGRSEDETPEIATNWGARLVRGGDGIAGDRNRGAAVARGDWLAFLDADTTVHPDWLAAMYRFARERSLGAATSRCRMPGARAALMAATINHVFPRLRRPILPGFNFWIVRSVFDAHGGFPDVPNEDTALSRRLSPGLGVEYHPRRLVTHSPRRIESSGLTGTLWHYVRLDYRRLRADS